MLFRSVWDIGKKKKIATFYHKGLVLRVAISSNGNYVASSDMDEEFVKIWDVKTGKEVYSFKHNGEIFGLDFSADDKMLASASISGNDYHQYIWIIENCKLIKEFPLSENSTEIKIAKDCKTLLVGSSNGIPVLWDINSAEPIQYFTGKNNIIVDACFIPKTDSFFVVDKNKKEIKFWTLKQLRRIEDRKSTRLYSSHCK